MPKGAVIDIRRKFSARAKRLRQQRQDQLDQNLIYAVAHQETQKDRVKDLLEKGANPNTLDETGWTCLHLAAVRNDPQILDWLIEYGAKVEATTPQGLTAFHLAARSGQTQNLRNLFNRGANTSPQCKRGETPLHLAIRYGQVDAAIALIDMRVPLNIKNKMGKRPIDLAGEEASIKDTLKLHSALGILLSNRTKQIVMRRTKRARPLPTLSPAALS